MAKEVNRVKPSARLCPTNLFSTEALETKQTEVNRVKPSAQHLESKQNGLAKYVNRAKPSVLTCSANLFSTEAS